MRTFTIFLILIMFNRINAQGAALIETPVNETTTITISDNQQTSATISQSTSKLAQEENAQFRYSQGQSAKVYNLTTNFSQYQSIEQSSFSMPLQQDYSSPSNIVSKENQGSVQECSNQQPNQQIGQAESIGSASPGMALHGLSVQQQQKLLSQQKLLEQYGKNNSELWKYANYQKQKLLQLQQAWKEQARIAHQNAIKQRQQREKKEREQLQKMIAQQKLTRTQEIRYKQTLQFRERQTKFNSNLQLQGISSQYKHHFNQYMFELDAADFQDFEINLVVDQSIAIHATTYTNNNGVYAKTTQVDDDMPPYLQVYHDGKFVILSQHFYFKKFALFQGKANTKYLIRMNNPGKARLFSLSVVQVIDQNQISHALTADDFITYGPRSAKIYEQLKHQMEHNYGLGLIQISNQNALNNKFNNYFNYSLLELFFVISACLIQLKLIQKLLTTSSIV